MSSLGGRFWSKVDKSHQGGCWLWTASTTHDGYGRYKLSTKQEVKAHRASYEYSVGKIPAGLQLDHQCRNRRCVRPSHLKLVTQALNSQNRSGAMSNSGTGVRGVHLDKRSGRFIATAVAFGRRVTVGSYSNLTDADRAVRLWRSENYPNSIDDHAYASNLLAELAA